MNVIIDGNNLFATTRGEIYCLDPQGGGIRWHNPLKGYGLGLVTIAADGVAPNTAASMLKRDAACAGTVAIMAAAKIKQGMAVRMEMADAEILPADAQEGLLHQLEALPPDLMVHVLTQLRGVLATQEPWPAGESPPGAVT